MTYSSEVLADAPWAWWRMQETAGTTLADASGNSRSMTITGTAHTFGQPSPVVSDTDAKAVSWSTAAGRASSVTSAYGAGGTYEVWIYLPSNPTNTSLVFAGADAAGPICDIRVMPGPVLWFYVYNGGSIGLTANLSVGQWYHVVASVGPAGQKLRINKAQEGFHANTGWKSGGATFWLRGNNVYNPTHAEMVLAEPAYYTAQLSDARTDAHYDAAGGVPPTPSGNLAVTLPALTSSLSGAYVSPPVAGSLAAILPALAANLSGAYDGPAPPVSGDLAATLPPLLTSLAGTYAAPPVETSTRYANDGYGYDGMAAVYYEDAIAPTPAHINRSKVLRVHQSMSAPNLVNGVPR